MFHESQLKKCLRVPTEETPLETLDVQEDLTYREHPVRVLEEANEELGTVLLSSLKFSGRTILRMKLHGNEKSVSVQTTPLSFPSETNLGTRFL